MHFVGPDQLHGFEERLTTDVYPAGLDWMPDWRLADRRAPALVPRPVERAAGRAGAGDAADGLRRGGRVPRAPGARRRGARARRGRFLLVASFTHPHDPYEVPPALLGPLRRRRDRPPRRAGSRPSSPTRHAAGCARMFDADRTPRRRPSRSRPRGAATTRRSASSTTTSARCSRRSTSQGLARRHDRPRHLRPRRHAGRAGALVQDGAFEPSARVPLLVHAPRRSAAAAGRGAGLAARPRADAGRARGRRPGGRPPRRREPRAAAARRAPARATATWRSSTSPRACARRR